MGSVSCTQKGVPQDMSRLRYIRCMACIALAGLLLGAMACLLRYSSGLA